MGIYLRHESRRGSQNLEWRFPHLLGGTSVTVDEEHLPSNSLARQECIRSGSPVRPRSSLQVPGAVTRRIRYRSRRRDHGKRQGYFDGDAGWFCTSFLLSRQRSTSPVSSCGSTAQARTAEGPTTSSAPPEIRWAIQPLPQRRATSLSLLLWGSDPPALL